MARLYMLLFALEIILAVLALISCLSAYEGQVRTLPKAVWVITILLIPWIGSIAYFAFGRPRSETSAATDAWGPGPGLPQPDPRPRQLAPDDDPAFLKAIDAQTRRSDEELLRRWEEDLRRREDELRRKKDLPPSDG
jgi:hypothetical protein